MNPQKSDTNLFSLQIRVAIVLALLLSAFFLLERDSGINHGQAQTSTQEQAQESSQEIEEVPPGQEKKLEDKIPSHLPIKVKVKNLNSKKWAHDLEVEVKNTSEKPIYFLLFYVDLPDVKGSTGNIVGFQMRYGRMPLIKFTTPLEFNDVPIQPGEVHVFKISKPFAEGWDYLREKEHKREPKRIRLIFQLLNFGDGTGYADVGGRFVDIPSQSVLIVEYVPHRRTLPPSLSYNPLPPSYRQAFCR